MVASISCPQCNQPVDPHARYCEHCGVDLAFAAVAAEQAMITPEPLPAGIPLAPEILVPRIGESLMEKGLLKPEGLQKALRYQEQQAAGGHPILLGQALLELNLVTRETLDQVVTTQILQLQAALNNANRQLEQRVQERTQDLQRALNRLSELNQLKSNFIANISHELRTPLTHIKGYMDLLVNDALGPLNEQQADAMQVIQKSESRLEQLIEDLIQFSLVSRGELMLNLSACRPERVIQAALERNQNKAKANSISLGSHVAEKLPALRVDEEKVAWVLIHLVDNAIKFTPRGGRVELEASCKEGFLTFAVMDTGIGIPPERVHEIFEPFHQLDGSATRRYGGTGLGLAMARRIIEAHGSHFSVKSVVGKGSRFEFSLPVIE